ncbi:ABC-2 family transporter protein-domain-containing protein [Blyttiomyces helicus]|uniref:ABC-2 family transporter protein-domain-containing protein n=1 Tax=Blyttiomyces helicus TaxID=388810 RepID=A0A4P9W9N5_9FUNG|nr:ABC-2 family transporter protein-domain-containing protein [Blyttiomyces helicus]|eukprot:RKO88193.1 ABC-2 family transporter protein-domain-containing protein [Blyttiomyces helicus]
MPSTTRQAGLLVRKNFRLFRNNVAGEAGLAFGGPLIAVALTIYLYTIFKTAEDNKITHIKPDLGRFASADLGPLAVVTDGSPQASNIVAKLAALGATPLNFTSEAAMETYCRAEHCWAGVVFDAPRSTGTWDYTLRCDERNWQITRWRPTNYDPPEVMASLQIAVDHAIMSSINTSVGAAASAAPITVTQLNNGVIRQLEYSFFESYMGALLICSFLPLVYSMLSRTVAEKEARLKEGMLMMGLTPSAYTLSWFVTYLVLYLPASLVAPVALRATIYSNTSIPILIILYIGTLINMIALCFMVEPFLSSPRSGAMAVAAMLLVFSASAAVFNTKAWDASSAAKTAASLVSPVAFMYANRVVAHFEGNYNGLSFSTISGRSARERRNEDVGVREGRAEVI